MYTNINNPDQISTRILRGQNARLVWEQEDGSITKYPTEVEQVDFEWPVLQLLEEQGFDNAPKLYDATSCSITMQAINSAGTLMDYFNLYSSNPSLYKEEMRKIWEATLEVVSEFHSLGWVHGDLHALNIVYEYEHEKWIPYLIDFSSSYQEEKVVEFCDLRGLIREEIYTAEEDLEFLEEYILDNYPGEPEEVYKITG